MKISKIFIPLFAVVLILSISINDSVTAAESISQKVIRLHILANSNSNKDQATKLLIRDYVLNNFSNIFNGKTIQDNLEIANNNKNKIESEINEYLKIMNTDYECTVEVNKEFFSTRVYDDFTLPAGEYNALIINLGESKGHNWWCVIFPTVCLASCSASLDEYLTDDENKLIKDGFSPKFKIIEIYEKIKSEDIKNFGKSTEK